MRRRVVVLGTLLTLLGWGCVAEPSGGEMPGGEAPAAREEAPVLLVVATTSIVGDLVANVGGHRLELVVVIPVGADAHDFQASARQVALLQDADLVVGIGLGLETGLVSALGAAREAGANVLELGPLLSPIPSGVHDDAHEDEEHAHEDEHQHQDGDLDPHVWFDPVRMADAVTILAERLAALDPDGAQEIAQRGEAYRAAIMETHRQVEEILAEVPPQRRKLVTNHDALGYFALRYRFEVIGTVVPASTTLAEPGAEALARLTRVIEEEGIAAIFAEATDSSVLAEAVAAEVGHEVQVVELFTESLGPPGSGAETYLGFLLTNARRIAEALR